ncbi:hypothetical protein J2T57_002291 [Natronocella acetinitrilica]|uniref:Uncharacterized protein n=1 Tax=Natronocella acetinitrilica TaxID=414046 RepID=A0AAE3G4S1_9GAMM|nr:hypothetical protein [Natronocella acetinitrilica]MCP1675143.1 hypothetical protein [Natronocella acetinitrilica]
MPGKTEVLRQLCRPVIGLALLAAGSMILATVLLGQATATTGVIVSVASILAGVALLASLVCVAEFFLAAQAWYRWSSGAGKRCEGCDWPISPSMVIRERCINPGHEHHGPAK